MARRTQATINGERTNGDGPPPSTLAAQLVQNQTRQTTSQPQDENATFRGLLHEILHNHAATQEGDVAVNAQLVSVVNQAGLVPLTLDNPFADWEVLIQQAGDSIAVIETTVRRQPEVLLIQLNPDGPQLVLNLLATLLAFYGRPKCEDLVIAPLLGSILEALSSSIDLWQQAGVFREVLQECMNEALSALEAPHKPNAAVSVSLPPARALSRLWPQSENSIAMPPGSITTITDPARAFVLALELCEVSGLSAPWQQDAHQRLQRLAFPLKTPLAKAQQWERVLARLMKLPHSWHLLASLLGDLTKIRPSASVQMLLARGLLGLLKSDNQAARAAILPVLRIIVIDDAWQEFHEDLKIAITTWYCRFEANDQLPEPLAALRNSLRGEDVMTDNELQVTFQQLSISQPCVGRRPRLRKRRRISVEEPESRQTKCLQRVSRLLTGVESADLSAVPEVAPSVYLRLQEDDKCAAWQSLVELTEFDVSTALQIVSRLLDVPELHDTKRPRVLSLQAIKACVARTEDPDYTSLANSSFGQTVRSSLYSSLRELRIAAGQCISYFLRDSLPEGIRTENRQLALQTLRKLSDRNVANEQETLIAAWGQVALSCGDSELNLVLLRLVDYLGHTNPFVCALAFNEVESVANDKGVTPKELFQPFWRSVAVTVVQDLNTRPQKAQQLCDLIGMEINGFLVMTQLDTLPFLVLTKKKDIIQRIANARGHSATVQDVLMQPRTNLAAILAFLLSQSSHDAEDFAFACLTDVEPELRKTDLSSLVKLDAVLVACEMLKLSGDESDDRKSRAYQAFQVFANIAERTPGQRRAHSKSAKLVGQCLEDKMLGILTHTSTTLEGGPGAESVAEKIRCLKGVADMFTLAKGKLSLALPQIRSCLHSGLEQPELCEVAFNAWLSLIPVLEAEDIPDIVDETFALIVRHWPVVSTETQRRTHEMLSQLVKTHNTILQENLMTLPSLEGIPLLSKYAAEFDRLKAQETVESHCKAFTKRLRDDSDTVVLQAMTEIVPFLESHQDFVHDTAASEHQSPVLTELLCALLDVTVKYSSAKPIAAESCGKALGIIGCLDPNRVEATRGKRRLLMLSNFEKASEVIDWVVSLLEDVLVKVFKSVTNARAQGFLAFTMQELLAFCSFGEVAALRPRGSQAPDTLTRWNQMPEHVRTTLSPLLTSRYRVTSTNAPAAPNREYPGYTPDQSHVHWLRSVVYDLMFKGKGDNAKSIFGLLARTIRGHDLAISRFVFPHAVLNVIVGGTEPEFRQVRDEFKAVLESVPTSAAQQESIRLCSETVFAALDHMSTWLQEKRKGLSETRTAAYKTGISPDAFDEARDMGHIQTVDRFLASIPAAIIANRAMDCNSYSRALFHWEQHLRQEGCYRPSGRMSEEQEGMFDRLQEIYSQIDEPDGLEGIAQLLPLISEQQQTINHAKAGRWTAAQAWYELRLADEPTSTNLQHELLKCLRETGQHAPLLRYANSFLDAGQSGENLPSAIRAHLPLAAEACWQTEDFGGLHRRLQMRPPELASEFNLGVGQALLHAAGSSDGLFMNQISALRKSVTESLSMSSTSSLQTCHNELLKLHTLYEMEALMERNKTRVPQLTKTFEKRLNAIGAFVHDKQYVLGVRRAVMRLQSESYSQAKTGALWLTTARLARQSKNTNSAYNAVLQAWACYERGAKIEEARLLWHEGHQRQAIQSLDATIESGLLEGEDPESSSTMDVSVSINLSEINGYKQNPLLGKALLLLAKWLDASGQSQTKDMTDRYQLAARRHQRWEKGHYYLGKHYSKLLDAQKALPKDKQSASFLTGEMTKLVIDNSLRSIPFGNKYWHETIPRVLTLWLQLGMDAEKRSPKEDHFTFDKRVKSLQACNKQLQKYFERVPAYVFYQALPQLISRITHPHPEVWKQLCYILVRIASSHPSQTLWSLFAVVKATDKTRVARGKEVLDKLKDPKNKPKNDTSGVDLRTTITQGQRLCDGLLLACEQPIEQRAVNVSLTNNLLFNSKLAPSNLVVPVEATLQVSVPGGSNSEMIRKHKAFGHDKVTIQAFMDDVLVLNSLQRPRKITLRGSDGKLYALLCKPKDDLRKDQRLMEFNGIINRALKRNTESSKRRLYIKTYAVTPLSEESGAIEWVEGIKPMRDILLNTYQRRGVRPNYNDIRKTLDEASSAPEHAHIFAEKVLSQFQPVLHEWFTETYPEPEVWFNARLRYARSAAVMSMVGHILGLGDRHGENILLEESTGGVFHVDFNCLFDKGLTFEKPELVPFRLTHNMVNAMGPYGHEGPFRKSSELTLGLLRQERDTLMTVLETFLYDPTTDFVGKKKRSTAGVPETPAEILESVATKLKGLLRTETVPLSVEGYVDALISEATSHFRLASMYIGEFGPTIVMSKLLSWKFLHCYFGYVKLSRWLQVGARSCDERKNS